MMTSHQNSNLENMAEYARSGASPTNDISIEFEIRSNFAVL